MAGSAPLAGIIEPPPQDDPHKVFQIVEAFCGDGVVQLHEDIALNQSETTIRHTLGRIPTGYWIVSQNVFAMFQENKQKRTITKIVLQASRKSVVVDLLIF